MRWQILGYMPANVLPAIISILSVVIFTRLLSPAEFGTYNLGLSAVLFLQGSTYFSIQLAVVRLYPAAMREGNEANFLRTLWAGVGGVSLMSVIVLGTALAILPLGDATRTVLWVALPTLVLRSVVGINQAQYRSRNATLIFVLIECLHTGLGFAAGLALIILNGGSGVSVMTGLLVGAGVACVASSRSTIVRMSHGRFDPALFRRLATFVLPLAATYVVTGLLLYADRFLVDMLAGAGALGVYAVAFSLVERPTTLLCTLISTATFPMAVNAMEDEGIGAARQQTGRNGAALLALVLPACVGLALSSDHIAAVLVGPEFRNGVARLIPPLALAAFVRNTATHYLDHAFHLLRRSDLLMAVYGPAAVVNIILDLLFIPYFGVFGAVWASLTALIGALIVSIILGSKHFGLWLPTLEILRIGGALVLLIAVLLLFHPPLSMLGLAELVAAGGMTYGLGALALDLGSSRSRVEARLLGRSGGAAR